MVFYGWIEDQFPAPTPCHPLKAKAIARAP